MMRHRRIHPVFGLATSALLLRPTPAWAHVKWFSEFSFADRPLGAGEVLTPTFLGLALLSVVVIGALVWVDRGLGAMRWYQRTNEWLASRAGQSILVMRVGAGAWLLLSWQADALLAPELRLPAPWLGWVEFLLAFLLLFRATVPISGVGILLLYAFSIARFGMFHMLDYLLYAGIGYYLAVSNAARPRVRGSGLPALYLTVGFSLCWVALEKIVYPDWALYLLRENAQLALGLDPRFFLVGAAFVEFSLGYLLIINLLERPLALTITIVFFLTTLVFGKLEVIGHTPIHAALIVFLLEGHGGHFQPPIALHRRAGLRTAFASVNFALLLALLLVPYAALARQRYERARAEPSAPAGIIRPAPEPAQRTVTGAPR